MTEDVLGVEVRASGAARCRRLQLLGDWPELSELGLSGLRQGLEAQGPEHSCSSLLWWSLHGGC